MKKIRDRLKKILKKKGDSKGFTLLELIISVAVLSVIMVMIFSMMTSGSIFFEKSNSMMKVSYSLQETMSQIKETVIDCSKAIKIQEYSNTEFVVVNKLSDDSYMACAYKYDPDKKAIKYGETTFSSPTDTTLSSKIKCDTVLAEGVIAFSATPVKSNNQDSDTSLYRVKSLKVSVTVEKNGRSDSAVETIAPRNNPLMVTNYVEIPEE